MTISSAEQAAIELSAVVGTVKRGSLRVFGDWFGRPMDNIHVARSARSSGNTLIVCFNEGEELTVSDPADWVFTPDRFCVRRASRVVWRWFLYGRPHEPGNLYTVEHWVEDDGEVRARSDVGWYQPVFQPSPAESAAELLSDW
jgi:hypothetical protein